jgi:hypothetical protein
MPEEPDDESDELVEEVSEVEPELASQLGLSGARLRERRVMADETPLLESVGVPASRETASGTRLKRRLWPVT